MKIITIGGGSGMPVVNQALVGLGHKEIISIVTIFDSGGDSGRMRTDERGRILAFSDYWRSLMSLWQDGEKKEKWEDMLKFRDGRGRNFGNTFFQFMSEKSGDLSKVDSLFSRLVGAELCGQVVPVSLSPADIMFETVSGKIYRGEHNLDNFRMSSDYVIKLWLEPSVEANKEAIDSLNSADVIIVCPGSMYGSVLINFLPKGIGEAFVGSKAKKILFTNIMSSANENDNYSQNDYIKLFGQYLCTNKPFDLAVMADLSKLDKEKLNKVLSFYKMEHSQPIKYEKETIVPVLVEDIVKIEESNWTLRHSKQKLKDLFGRLLKQ